MYGDATTNNPDDVHAISAAILENMVAGKGVLFRLVPPEKGQTL